MALSLAAESVTVAARTWEPNQYVVVDAVLASPVSECADCDGLRLSRVSDGMVMDEVSVPQTRAGQQYAARVSGGKKVFALQDAGDRTLGSVNVDLGPVVQLTEHAGFRPRDSSPNAIVQYEGHYWVLGGWSNFAHDVWHSVPDVWKSRDGVNWHLVNATPPYSPYSAFVVFQDRIWAIGHESFSSTDGVQWRREALQMSLTRRAVAFRGALVAVTGDGVLRSVDGQTWTTLQDRMPWGPDRREPALLVHRERLWLIGGTDEPTDGPVVYRNDVWTSADGVTWTLVTGSAAWEPRRWLNAIAHDGRLWVMNGANYDLWPDESGNVADIWISDDGATWRRVQTPRLWGARRASFVAPSRDGGFIVAAGYGNGGVDRMYSDVWRVEFASSLLSAP